MNSSFSCNIHSRLAGLKAIEAIDESKTRKREIDFLANEVDRLFLINEAVWELLVEKLGLSEKNIVDKVNEIDLRDGRMDGKLAKEEPAYCPACGRTLLRGKPVCIYCGEESGISPFKR